MEEHHPHYVWAIVAILGIGVCAWVYSSNRANDSTYEKGSRHVEVVENNYPLSLHPCGAIFKVDGEAIKPIKNTIKK